MLITNPAALSAQQRDTVPVRRDTVATRDTVAARDPVATHEAIIVTSTRGERRIEDEPLRVEVVAREEIEEKLLMTPGDIAMLLNETAGLRVQPTSPALGGASVRIQGLRGRYTRMLSDGLPLHGGQTGALGPLQIPPMDLGQVEVIKGVASALYGGEAVGGVVNLVSRRPAEGGENEVLLNRSTLGGTDAVLWTSRTLSERWGYTLLSGGHAQSFADVDDDGWADLPRYRRALVRPRVFWNNGRGASALFTVGGMLEERRGGTLDVDPAGPSGYTESLDTRQLDAGGVARVLFGGSRLLSVRGSGTLQSHAHQWAERQEDDRHVTSFLEASLAGSAGAHRWVVGAAVQHEAYEAEDAAGFDFRHVVPGVFLQDEYALLPQLTAVASARWDHHSEYGHFLSPRVSLLFRPGSAAHDDEAAPDDLPDDPDDLHDDHDGDHGDDHDDVASDDHHDHHAGGLSVRLSVGGGWFGPTPWVEETEAVGLSRLDGWGHLRAERARSASVDVGYARGGLEFNVTAFGSIISNAVQATASTDDASRLRLFNAAGNVRTYGTELLARYHAEGVHITATHVWMRSTEPDPEAGLRREVPLTPEHSFGIVAALEQEGRGRAGVEFYFTGSQSLEDNPYRALSKPYVIVGLLAERRFGPARLFVNAENIFDARQTRHDPLLRPTATPQGRLTTDVWAPLEGRSFNGGVRWTF